MGDEKVSDGDLDLFMGGHDDLSSGDSPLSTNNDDGDMIFDDQASKLPRPDFDRKASSSVETDVPSVFSNPYRAVEDAKNLMLEKHVKMTPSCHQQAVNGKQLCWNYRKGRCRFGHKCKFLHESDIPGVVLYVPSPKDEVSVTLDRNSVLPDEPDINCEGETGEVGKTIPLKRKKPGITNSLIPPKRAAKAYKKQQEQERPWISK